ncbi:MAG TPA: hypothetical protein VK614_03735 [Allosphingosinicella sp.]|nr:hypothetical protein [Allosphingosinicella sp.]
MSEEVERKGAPRRIDVAAKAAFLAGLRRGESREDAAFAAGFSLMGFYGARRRDPAFSADWTEALATSAAEERRVRAYVERSERGERGEVRIACANRRVYQRRRRRNVRFDAERQAIYLAHFAANCDSRAAAAAAGVHESTVRLHRRNNPAFAETEAEALAAGYVWLEAEAVRLRLAAQARLRAALEATDGVVTPSLAAEMDADFDRTMKLLARCDRKPRRAERGFKLGGQRQKWTFEDAMVLLRRRLKALGLLPPPEGAGEGQESAK